MRIFLGVLIAVVVAFAGTDAQANGPALQGVPDSAFESTGEVAGNLEYYRKHARVRLGAESRLSNGTSWRLLTDTRMLVSVPRLTWMPDRQRLRRANLLLDMLHGVALRKADDELKQWRDLEVIRKELGMKPNDDDHVVEDTDVAVTYATAHLVSYVRLAYIHSYGSNQGKIYEGYTLDLTGGSIFQIDRCPGETKRYGHGDGTYLFRLGSLLRVCDVQAYKRFVALLERKAILQGKTAEVSENPNVQKCSELEGVRQFIDENQRIILYLTPKGLAVHNTEFWPESKRHDCTLWRSAANPVIIPWQELEPFMQPGRWRDDLLK